MANYFDSRSNDFNTAINDYKNNANSVAQQQLQGAIDQAGGAKSLLMEKTQVLAGASEAKTSDLLQAGVSHAMNELGLDMSVTGLGSKILPWAAKKIKGKVAQDEASRNEANEAARQDPRLGDSGRTEDAIPAGDDAARARYLDRMADEDNARGDGPQFNPSEGQNGLPRGGEQNTGAGGEDAGGRAPSNGGGDTAPQAQELDMVTGQPIRDARYEAQDDMPRAPVLDEDGKPMIDESTRIQNKQIDDANADGPGIDSLTGSRLRVGEGFQAPSQPAVDFSGAAARARPPPALSEEQASAPDLPSIDSLIAQPSDVGEDIFRGAYNPEQASALSRIGQSRQFAGAPARPNADIDAIPSRAPADLASEPIGGFSQITRTQQQLAQSGDSPATIADRGQIDAESGLNAARPGQTTWQSRLQNTQENVAQNLQEDTQLATRETADIGGEIAQSFGSKALGVAGDAFGFAADILAPAAAIWGGYEAIKGLRAGVADSEGANDPWSKAENLIGQAQTAAGGMNAEISADQFSEKLGSNRPSFGSLAAPTFDSSQLGGAMSGHF